MDFNICEKNIVSVELGMVLLLQTTLEDMTCLKQESLLEQVFCMIQSRAQDPAFFGNLQVVLVQ